MFAIIGIALVLTGIQIYIIKKFKKENQKLNKYKVIKNIADVSSKKRNIIKILRDINSVLLGELEMEYSSFFFYDEASGKLSLEETNIVNNDLARELINIKEYKSNGDNGDFKGVFEKNKYLFLYSKENLKYPTAMNREIKGAILIPLIFTDEVVGYWLIEDSNMNYIESLDVETLVIISDYLAALISSGVHTYMDSLMKIPKREFIEEFIKEKIEKREEISVVFADIDHFKRVNDSYGHDVGDEVLKVVSEILKQSIRPIDMIGRYGGEEILFCLSDCDKEKSKVRVEEMRKNLSRCELEINDKEIINITSSFGIATYPEDFNNQNIKVENIIKLADDRLYKAKEQGRNQVINQ